MRSVAIVLTDRLAERNIKLSDLESLLLREEIHTILIKPAPTRLIGRVLDRIRVRLHDILYYRWAEIRGWVKHRYRKEHPLEDKIVYGPGWPFAKSELIHKVLHTIFVSLPSSSEVELHDVDVLVITSCQSAIAQNFIRQAEKLSIPVVCLVNSWDHLTHGNRALKSPAIKAYGVWNEIQKNELIKEHFVSADLIHIVGPLQFDFLFKMKHALTKEACRKDLGIPSDDKVVFFPAYNHRLGKHEPYAIQQLLKARSEIPYSFTLLARPYPHRGDFESRFSPILDSKSQTIEPASSLKEDWELMAKLLVASDVILCGPGTVAVEAMFFDRPVVHLALDPKEDKNHQPLYKKYFFTDHYQHVMKHNASDYVQTSQEFISSVVANFSRTESKRVARENTIREQIYFINGSAASNVSSLIQKFLAP